MEKIEDWKRFSAILHEKWVVDQNTGCFIIGRWAEDMSSYTIDCPSQVRDLIVQLQNKLCEHYQALENMNKNYQQLSYEFGKFLG